jgi:hypothetical protein
MAYREILPGRGSLVVIYTAGVIRRACAQALGPAA